MSRTHRFSGLALISLLALGVASCNKDEAPTSANTSPQLQPLLAHSTNNIIVVIYNRLDLAAGALAASAAALQANPSQPNLEAVRDAWRTARIPWENSEAFLFGPVETSGIDPSIDSWPVNEVDLNAVLSSSATLTKEYIDGLEGTLKGFHTIEYLIFGLNSNKQLNGFTAREFQYLVAVTTSLKGETARLATAWSPTSQNFGANLINAGQSGSIYVSQKAALQEIVTGMLTIADEVANGKINDPFVQRDVTLEESRFSANSKADFQDNIRGVQYMYTGSYNNQSGASVSDVVKFFDTNLDTRVRAAIQNAIDKIGAIPGTFTAAIFNDRPAVQEAQDAVRNLHQILESEVAALISNRIQ